MKRERTCPRLSDTITIRPFDSAHIDPRYLVQDGSGRCFQISDAGRRVLLLLDGSRGYDDIARDLAGDPSISPEAVRLFVESGLQPLGLISGVHRDDPSPPSCPKPRALDPFFFRIPLFGEPRLRPLTRGLAWLFNTWCVVPALASAGVLHVLFYRGALVESGRLTGFECLLAYALTCLSVVVHEIGHASACRRFNCAHGPIGFGLYLIFPALYADVTPAWGLPRRSRAVIDAAGIYFQILFCLGLFAAWRLGASRAALGAIPAIDALIFMTLNPVLKFDGYWLFSDLSGVPNLRDRARAALMDMVGRILKRGRNSVVTRESETLAVGTLRAVQVYSVFMVGYFSFLVAQLGWLGPHLLRGFPVTIRHEWQRFLLGGADGDILSMTNAVLAVTFNTLMVAGWSLCAFCFMRMCWRVLLVRR